jgi:RNA polymerase sigma-70 factor (ECF subfamily)
MHIVSGKESGTRRVHEGKGSLAHLSDSVVVQRARGQDVEAFEELVGRTENGLYRLALHYVRNEHDAQEVLQNAYLAAWRSLPTFEGRAQFGCWIHRITVNASLMFLRTRNRHPEIPLDDLDPAELNDAIDQTAYSSPWREDRSPRPDEEFLSAELRRHIVSAVASLPQNLRSTFLLRDIGEESTGDTAGTLGVSIPAVKTRIHRARRVLRASLASYVAY